MTNFTLRFIHHQDIMRYSLDIIATFLCLMYSHVRLCEYAYETRGGVAWQVGRKRLPDNSWTLFDGGGPAPAGRPKGPRRGN